MHGRSKLAALPIRTIKQDEIETLISLENQIHSLQRQREELSSRLLSRRMDGVGVEPGMFQLEVITQASAGRREHRIVIR